MTAPEQARDAVLSAPAPPAQAVPTTRPGKLVALPAPPPWLCRHGWHRWRTVAVTNRRMAAAPLGSRTSACERERCDATRHEQHVVLSGGEHT